jgi:hypothetical protein
MVDETPMPLVANQQQLMTEAPFKQARLRGSISISPSVDYSRVYDKAKDGGSLSARAREA